MSDDIDVSDDKPKRKYLRRTITGDSTTDSVINDALVEEAERLMAEYEIEADTIEVVEDIEKPTVPASIFQEPTSNSLKGKILKKLGLCKSMLPTKWRGKDMWACERCKWTTFDPKRARRHYCE